MIRTLCTSTVLGTLLALSAPAGAQADFPLKKRPLTVVAPGQQGGPAGAGALAADMAGQVSFSAPSALKVRVNMRHWENGSEPYKLDSVNGNTKVTAHFSLTCPAGSYVVSIAYGPMPHALTEIYAYDGANQENAVAFSRQIEPLLFESYALAANWVLENNWEPHYAEYSVPRAKETVTDLLNVVSRCSGRSARSQEFLMTYRFDVRDLDYVAETAAGPRLKAVPALKQAAPERVRTQPARKSHLRFMPAN